MLFFTWMSLFKAAPPDPQTTTGQKKHGVPCPVWAPLHECKNRMFGVLWCSEPGLSYRGMDPKTECLKMHVLFKVFWEDHLWTTFGPLLDHFWTSFGPFLDCFRTTFWPLSHAFSKVIRGCGPSMSWIKLLFNISLQLTIQVPKNLSVVHIIFLFVELLLSALNFPLSRGAEIRFLHPSVCHSLTARIRSTFCHAFCLVH